jgi:hypothetical protein
LNQAKVISYYSREDVQRALLEAAKNREVVGVFRNKAFGKRPNMLQYPTDIVQMVREGVVSFHGSVERWSNPMSLRTEMSKVELDGLRIGWDMLFDVDVKDFEMAKVATNQVVEALRDHGIANLSLKFTGGSSFHLCVPFEALPPTINFKPTARQYPEVFEKVVGYVKSYVRDQLREELLALDNPLNLAGRVNKTIDEIIGEAGIDPFKLISLDVFGSRHLFRLPYSLHESSFLVSLPLKASELKGFRKEDASPERARVRERFLVPSTSLHDAEGLVVEALDWASRHRVEKPLPKPIKPLPKLRFIPEKFYPPCIHTILKGLSDGRKRSVFILINFLRNMGWGWEKIEKKLVEWNEKNYTPLRTAYLRTQLRWHMQQKRNILPPNCDNPNFYRDFGVCQPDSICEGMRIKNPLTYPFRRMRTRALS